MDEQNRWDESLGGLKELEQAADSSAESISKITKGLADSVSAGVNQGSRTLQTELKKMLSGAVKAAKQALGIHSPSKVMQDEVGKQIVSGIAAGIEDNKNLTQKALSELNDGMLASEHAYLTEKERLTKENALLEENKRQREYQIRLASAKDAVTAEKIMQDEILRRKELADDQYLEQLKQTAEKEKTILEQLKEDVRDIYSDIAQYAEENLSEVYKAQEKLEEKLSDFGSLTSKEVFLGAGEDGEDLEFFTLADLGAQIQALEQYGDALSAVKRRMEERGFSKENAQAFFAAMTELTVEEGTRFAQLLAGADDAEFSNYLSQWIKKQELSEAISKTLYYEQFKDAVDDTKQYMVDKLKEAGLEIPEGFFVSGSISAENFGNAFLEEMQDQMEKVKTWAESFTLSFTPDNAGVSSQPVQNAYHSTTYVLNGSGETVAQQLMSARSHSELERMRNG